MRIMVINPNTSVSMTEHLRRELNRVKRKDTELLVTCPDVGPLVIESSYDEALSVPSTLEFVREANRKGFDAIIIACFSDPGLMASREISDITVLGIHEVSLHCCDAGCEILDLDNDNKARSSQDRRSP